MTPREILRTSERGALLDLIRADLERRNADDLRIVLRVLEIDRLAAAEAGVTGEGTTTALGLVHNDVRRVWLNVDRLIEYGDAASIGGGGMVVRGR